jgi:hypothetical protein
MGGGRLALLPKSLFCALFLCAGLALAGSARGGAWKLFAMNFPPGKKFRWKTF